MGVNMEEHLATLPAESTEQYDLTDIPSDFDSRTNWQQCPSIGTIRDQSMCGSCWAFGAVEAMTDRLCIASNAKTNVALSAEDMLSCCGSCGMGCNGGNPSAAWAFWQSEGLVAESVYPYAFPTCEHHINGTKPPCGPVQPTPSCDDSKLKNTKYSGKSHYSVGGLFDREKKIQAEIQAHGPIEVAFTVYEDFLTYRSGVCVAPARAPALPFAVCRLPLPLPTPLAGVAARR